MIKKRGPGRPRKLGRPKKPPGAPTDHRLTPKMKSAIEAIVQDNMSRKEAAKLADLTDEAVRKAMRDNGAVREFYSAEVRALKIFSKARAVHTLIKEMDGPNASARVAAARTILEESERTPAGSGVSQVPGFAILIADARTAPQAIDVTPLPLLPLHRNHPSES